MILDTKGRITVGAEAAALREKVAAVAASGSDNMVLNLAHVDYIDSTGLGALVMCATTMRKAGGHGQAAQPEPPQYRASGDDQAGHGVRPVHR